MYSIIAIWRWCCSLGRQTESYQCFIWCMDRCTETMGIPGGYIYW